MPQLAISLLGPFQVTQDGHPVTKFETDLARALLAYLAMQAGTDFSRETLATFFWPDSSIEEALHALRQTLNRLRSALGDKGAENNYLKITRRALQFHMESDFWLDVTAFSNLVAATSRHPHHRLESCRSCNQQLLKASRLWRGDFLSTLNVNSLLFQEWRTTTAERLRIQAVETFGHLANYYEQSGDYEQARVFAWHQLELESWREEAHRQLMRILAISGQRSAAIAQYETCCRILESELMCEPDLETVALYEQIRSGRSQHQKPFHTNLPVYPTAFVGRENELEQITDLLQHHDCHLLTLVGFGGMGKTRLAVQVAIQVSRFYRDGVVFTPLSALASPTQLLTALAQVLQFPISPQQDLKVQLYHYLYQKEILIVLDGFEHVLEAAEQISELLSYAPGVQILITSRERLNISAEWIYDVGGLTYSMDGRAEETEMDYSAVQLFVQVARRVRRDFIGEKSVIAKICRSVDGMPLAIELAASWARVLSCPEIAQEIQRDLGFLHAKLRDVPEHHRSLDAVFASAWAFLTLEESSTLCQLSVFRGGFSGAAAVAVTSAQPALLAALADKSWLRQDERDQATHYALHDLVQRYTAGQLANEPELEIAARDQHSHYYTAWLHSFLITLKSNEQRAALDQIGAEIENVRAAWDWAVSRGLTTEIDLAWESLFLFYDLRSWLQEGESAFGQLAQAFAGKQNLTEQTLLGCALFCQGWFVSLSGRNQPARMLLEQSVALLRETQQHYALALALSYLGTVLSNLGLFAEAKEPCQESLELFQKLGDHYDKIMSLNTLGLLADHQGNYLEAQEYCQTSLELARTANLRKREAESLHRFGTIVATLTSWNEAIAYFEQALECYREVGNVWGESSVLLDLGGVLSQQGDYVRARIYLNQALQAKQQIGDCQGEAVTLMKLGNLAARQDEYELARSHNDRALNIAREIGDQWNEGILLHNIAATEMRQGNWASADDHLKQALSILQKIGDKGTQGLLFANLGSVALQQGDFANARDHLEQALAISRETGYQQGLRVALANPALLFHYTGDQETAESYSRQTLRLAKEIKNQPEQARALIYLGYSLQGSGNWAEAHDAYEESLELYCQLGETRLMIEAQACVASVALAQGDLLQAQALLTDVLNYLLIAAFDGIGIRDPIRVYLTCYQVLRANDDPRAIDILGNGYSFLQARAARTSNEDLKRSFLENIPSHRELLAEWSKWIEG